VKCAGEAISLTPSEFKLLQTLAQNRGRVLTRESLIQHVQGEVVSVVGRTVDTHVFGLRKKLGDCADVIETVRGIGYRVKALDQ
jgi:two-component system phosphate regulon response regulator PhoB